MPSTALAIDQVENAPKPTKERRISKRIQQAVDALLSGKAKTQRQAAELANLHESHLSRELGKAHIQAFIARKTRQNIQRGTMRASARVIELIDASSEHVSLDASKHVLAIEGIRPPENGVNVNINNNISVGYIVKLRHADVPTQASHALPITIDADKV